MRKRVEQFGELLHNAFERPFQGKTIKERDNLVLPTGIREALATRPTADISKTELQEFLNYSQFLDQGVYLVSKILDTDPTLQQAFLTDLVSVEEKNPDDIAVVQELLQQYTEKVDDAATVQAGKLAQISRQGFYNWQDLYHEYTSTWDDRFGHDTVPVLAAYATLGGLRTFVGTFKERKQPVYIMIPSHFKDTDSPIAGYKIEAYAEDIQDRVIPLPNNFDRPNRAAIIDETTTTGTALKELESFWNEGVDDGVHEVRAVGMVQGDKEEKYRKMHKQMGEEI